MNLVMADKRQQEASIISFCAPLRMIYIDGGEGGGGGGGGGGESVQIWYNINRTSSMHSIPD